MGGEALNIPVRGEKAVSFTFTDGEKPLRTPFGLPDGVSVTVDGKRAESGISKRIWSGCSWIYVALNGAREIGIANSGADAVTVKYEFYEV